MLFFLLKNKQDYGVYNLGICPVMILGRDVLLKSTIHPIFYFSLSFSGRDLANLSFSQKTLKMMVTHLFPSVQEREGFHLLHPILDPLGDGTP